MHVNDTMFFEQRGQYANYLSYTRSVGAGLTYNQHITLSHDDDYYHYIFSSRRIKA